MTLIEEFTKHLAPYHLRQRMMENRDLSEAFKHCQYRWGEWQFSGCVRATTWVHLERTKGGRYLPMFYEHRDYFSPGVGHVTNEEPWPTDAEMLRWLDSQPDSRLTVNGVSVDGCDKLFNPLDPKELAEACIALANKRALPQPQPRRS